MKTSGSVLGTNVPKKRGPINRLHRFFHADEAPYALALVRIVLPLVLMAVVVHRWGVARELYSTDGAPAQLSVMYGHPPMMPELSGGMVVALFTLLGFFLATSSLGWYTRLSLGVATVLYFYFNMLDSVSTITKYSVIATHALLLLAISNCGSAWSIDAWRQRRRRGASEPWAAEPAVPRSPVWPRRLMQLMIGVVYFGAAITKLHTPAFFSGDQLMFWLITHVNFANPFGNLMALFPAVLVVFAYVTIVWELLFVFLAWKGWSRNVMLALGAMFHLGTSMMLGLYIFPAVCMSLYLAFLDESDVLRIAARLRRLWGGRSRSAVRVPSASTAAPAGRRWLGAPAAFAILAAGVALAGVELEYWMDPYGQRRPEGPYTLKEISRERSRQLLLPSPPVRDKDLVFSFEVGTSMFGGHLIGRRDEFQHGEMLLAQVKFNPPHGDMWIECNLHDAEGRVIDQVGQVISREMLRGNWYYPLSPALEPGEYKLVLKKAGREIDYRPFRLLPAAGDSRTAVIPDPAGPGSAN